MAKIIKRSKKDGTCSYCIRVSNGYDREGRQVLVNRTFTPPPGLTGKKLEKELQRQADAFEQEVHNGISLDASMKVDDLIERWFTEYAEKKLKPKTVYDYRRLVPRISAGLGQLKVCQIKPSHLMAFYSNLEEQGVREDSTYTAVPALLDQLPKGKRGQIAAANALSDVYAMGGEVKTALNLVCFPESMDLNILGEILRGGAEKVAEAGGILAGGHSIADTGVKYGLSVTGLVDPRRLTANDTGKPGDKLILTKALGVGLICTANRVGEAAPGAMDAAVASMTTLNKSAAEISRSYDVHAATDVTGFSFLGHLHEMMGGRLSCRIDGSAVPVLPGAWQAADDCLYTAAGQRNRNHTGPFVQFENVPFAMQEILFDPQTSGGLLLAVAPEEAEHLRDELQKAGLPAQIVGEITEKQDAEIVVSYPE